MGMKESFSPKCFLALRCRLIDILKNMHQNVEILADAIDTWIASVYIQYLNGATPSRSDLDLADKQLNGTIAPEMSQPLQECMYANWGNHESNSISCFLSNQETNERNS